MQDIELDYGDGKMAVELPDTATIVRYGKTYIDPPKVDPVEATRQALLKSSLPETQAAAKALAAEATKAKNAKIAEQAAAVAKSPDIAKAQAAFATLSDGTRPSVYYCPMVKKSWLQPKGDVGNPYDKSMQMCGVLKEE